MATEETAFSRTTPKSAVRHWQEWGVWKWYVYWEDTIVSVVVTGADKEVEPTWPVMGIDGAGYDKGLLMEEDLGGNIWYEVKRTTP